MNSQPSRPARTAAFRLLFGALMVVGIGNSMLFAVLPPVARQIGLPDAMTGAIFSLSAFIWVFASPFWGRRSDRVGRKPIITQGLAAYCVSMTLFALVAWAGLQHWASWPVIFIGLVFSRAIFGTFGSAASPAAQAYVADRTTQSERTDELAALGAAFALGSALGPAVCGQLAAKLGMVAPIALTAVLAAAASFAVHRFLPENRPPKDDEAPEVPKMSDSWKLATDPRLAPFLIYGLGLSIVGGTMAQTYSYYTMDTLHVTGSTGVEYSAAGFMVGALALLVAQLAILPRLKISVRALMIVGALLCALGVGLQIIAGSLSGLLLAQMMLGLGGGLARPGFSGGSSLAVTPQEQGASAGLVVAVNGAGFVISPLTGGWLYSVAGKEAPLYVCVALLLLMAAFAWRSRRIRSSVETPPTPPPEPTA